MQDVWILFNLDLEFGTIKALEIQALGYERVLIGVSKNNKVILQSLDKNGKPIANNIKVIK